MDGIQSSVWRNRQSIKKPTSETVKVSCAYLAKIIRDPLVSSGFKWFSGFALFFFSSFFNKYYVKSLTVNFKLDRKSTISST